MKKYFFFFFSILCFFKNYAQEDNYIIKNIVAQDSTIILDTNYINQNEFFVYHKDLELLDSLYNINFSTGEIFFHKSLYQDTIRISYKLLNPNIFFSKRDTNLYIPFVEKEPVFLQKNIVNNQNKKLHTNGSMQRSFANGNNQSFSINTDIDLQISGKITDNLFLDCNISDSSIPLNYGQSTTSFQEIDKIFIKLYNSKISLMGGDIIMNNLEDPFLNFNRNAIGINYNYTDSLFPTNASIGITKNIFRRQLINPTNGNQGPYKLTGENNDFYILIIPNSESVFIDGVKKQKGVTKDYTINYNTGEIIFTTNTIINENQRIIIEFQYSGQNYFRWISHFGTKLKRGNMKLRINFFNEQDNKSNPILSFSENELNTMINNGDGLIFSNYFPPLEGPHNNSQILYEIRDTIDQEFVQHDSIYVFSNNQNTTLYNVNFEYVGSGQGNYILESNLLNGNIFVWVSPLNGEKKGNYEPRKKLLTPQKKQMITLGLDYLKNKSQFSYNIALSNNDKNLFSKIDDEDNFSWAMNVFAKTEMKFNNTKLESSINYEFLEKNFSFIERTRDLEFSRNWNITDSTFFEKKQHILNFQIISDFYKNRKVSYQFEFMDIKNTKKLRQLINGDIQSENWKTTLFTSFLNDYGIDYNLAFLQYNFVLEKKGPLKIGIQNIGEEKIDRTNQTKDGGFNKMVLYSSIFNQEKKILGINYINRFDVKPQNLGDSNENTLEIVTDLINKKNAKLNIQSTYSKYCSNMQDSVKTEENIMGRLNYSLDFINQVRFSGFYEISNGQEFLRDFRYIKVNPGYGSFTWVDYNNNGLEEFDEFETSNFVDTADYIRISFPTNQSFNVRKIKYNQQININPNFNNDSKLISFIESFKNSTNIQIHKKFLADDLGTIINPFNLNPESANNLSVNLNITNNLIYRSNNNKHLISYNTKKIILKHTLSYGDESSRIYSHDIRGQKTIGLMTLNVNYFNSSKKTNNQNMVDRNYLIRKNKLSTELFCYFDNFTPSIILSYINKNNTNHETLKGITVNMGLDYSFSKKMTIKSNLKGFNMNYSGDELSPIGHDMLEGLADGRGLETQISINKLINQTNLSIEYIGRFSEKNIIHGGRFELKKYF